MSKPDPKMPLGKPVNRKAQPELTPIAGRPNWWQPRHGGAPVYIEPPRKAT